MLCRLDSFQFGFLVCSTGVSDPLTHFWSPGGELTLRVIGHPGAFMYIVILSHFTVKQGDNVLDLKLFYVIL